MKITQDTKHELEWERGEDDGTYRLRAQVQHACATLIIGEDVVTEWVMGREELLALRALINKTLRLLDG